MELRPVVIDEDGPEQECSSEPALRTGDGRASAKISRSPRATRELEWWDEDHHEPSGRLACGQAVLLLTIGEAVALAEAGDPVAGRQVLKDGLRWASDLSAGTWKDNWLVSQYAAALRRFADTYGDPPGSKSSGDPVEHGIHWCQRIEPCHEERDGPR